MKFTPGIVITLLVLWAIWVSASIYNLNKEANGLGQVVLKHDQNLFPENYAPPIKARPSPTPGQ